MNAISEKLEEEKKRGFSFEGEYALDMIERLLPYIGATDPYLRDNLVYSAIATLTTRRTLTSTDYKKLLDIYLSSDFLFYDIDSDRVEPALKRAFTLLQLCVVLDVEKDRHVLTHDDLDRLLDSLLDYYTREKVLMGYHDDYGWVHTIAHSADLFKGLFALNALSESRMGAALGAIRGRFIEGAHTYGHGEDLRTAKALLEGVRAGSIPPALLSSFIEGFERVRALETSHEGVFPESTVIRRTNATHLLEALLVGLTDIDGYEDLILSIKRLLHSW